MNRCHDIIRQGRVRAAAVKNGIYDVALIGGCECRYAAWGLRGDGRQLDCVERRGRYNRVGNNGNGDQRSLIFAIVRSSKENGSCRCFYECKG